MTRSRTIRSLTALVIAMTLGTFVLMFLELKADPLRPAVDPLAAKRSSGGDLPTVIESTETPVQYLKWRNIVVHSAARGDEDVARGCHFLVRPRAQGGGYEVVATDRWQRQDDGDHVFVRGFDYNRTSIGVCLMGEFSARPPTHEQFEKLVSLVRLLRQCCRIPSDHVYLARHLPIRRKSPGREFPAKYFEGRVSAPLR